MAYAIGLIASDGSLSKDGRHITFVSKDIEQINNLESILGISISPSIIDKNINHIYRRHISDKNFYNFLLVIGLTSNKSLTIGKLDIPEKYFFDYLRGFFDGDGSFYSYFDKRWKSSFMMYMSFASGSIDHLRWIKGNIEKLINVNGHITFSKKANNRCYQLKFSKYSAIPIIENMYKNKRKMFLSRKYLKIKHTLAIVRRCTQ